MTTATKPDRKTAAAFRKLAAFDRADWANDKSGGTCFTHVGWKATVWFQDGDSGNQAGPQPPAAAIAALQDAANPRRAPSAATVAALARFAAIERGRYALNSTLIEWHANPRRGVDLCATDGRRLANIVHADKYGEKVASRKMTRLHVNAQALAHVLDVLEKYAGRWPGVVWAAIDGDAPSLALRAGSTFAVIAQADGEYPEWQQVMPAVEHAVPVDRAFFGAMEKLAYVTSVESQAVRVEIGTRVDAPKRANITLRARAILGAGAKIDSAADLGDVDKLENTADTAIGFDPLYMVDADRLLATRDAYGHRSRDFAKITLGYTDKDTGAVLRNSACPDDVILIMPIDI